MAGRFDRDELVFLMKREAARSNKVSPVHVTHLSSCLPIAACPDVHIQSNQHSTGTVKEAAQKSFEALVKYCEEPWFVLTRHLLCECYYILCTYMYVAVVGMRQLPSILETQNPPVTSHVTTARTLWSQRSSAAV